MSWPEELQDLADGAVDSFFNRLATGAVSHDARPADQQPDFKLTLAPEVLGRDNLDNLDETAT